MNTLSQPANIRDSLPARESVMVLEAGDVLYDHSGGSSYVIVEPRSGQAEVTNRFHVVVYEGPEARLYQALQLSRAGKTLRPPARVALKIAISHGFNGQISAEAQRQSQLSQRAKGEVIAPVIDQGEHQGHVFYTTPWYSQTLDSWLEQAAPDLIQRLGALARLCQATTALHTADAQGLRIVHGDIKPQNIAILAEGPRQILRFLDLGTTRQTSERTVGPLGARAYSLGYSPPGQLIPGAPTLRSDDAFAVAACLFRALSGHRPACASLDYRAAIRRDAPWEQTDKAGDPALFFRLKVFYELLEGQDLPGLQEQVSEEALKALQGQDDGAQDPALAQHQQALAQQVAERLVTLVRDGLQPEPRKRRQDWLEDAARELEALVALLLAPPQPQEQRPPAPTPAPLPQPAPRHGGWSLAAGLGLGVALTLMVQMPWSQRWAGQEGVAEEAPVGEVAGTLAPEPAAPAPEEPTPEPEPPEPVETEDQAALRQCRESKEGKSCYTLAKKWAAKRDTRELAIEALDVACSAGVGDACQDLGTI
ncbi:MAG: hypothetical protein IPN01_36200 [Deltaproteobacteria bacterium]|nr:hypothetical protein [Deltaproteobacteria bacterium]